VRRLFTLVALALAGLALAPAGAADVRQIDCPLNEMSAPDRAAYAAFVTEGAGAAGGADPRREPFRRALLACAERFGWSEPAVIQAAAFSIGQLGQAEIRRQMTALGLDLTELERAAIADTELLAAVRNGTFTRETGAAFAQRNNGLLMRLTAGQPDEVRVARKLGNFVGFIAVMETARSRFAQS